MRVRRVRLRDKRMLSLERCAAAEMDRRGMPAGGTVERAFSTFNPGRFAHLSEAEVLRRIGGLLATALLRSGRLSQRDARTAAGRTNSLSLPIVDPVALIRDPVARRVATFLCIAGPSAPSELAIALGITRPTLTRKLHLLRLGGLCAVTGKTRTARYEFRADFAGN
ncbi:MAG: helix-turn-helix transcriptional regulator [Verrucomicrobia bacterium]|nr:helix-turn-helix transcriptional regulator [Verrucomicrobiota bacterium]